MLKPIDKQPLLNAITRKLIEALQNDQIERSLPVQWSYMHLFSSIQIAKLVSIKRNLDLKVAVLCVALHDLATILKGIRENHAEMGAELLEDFLAEVYLENSHLPQLTADEFAIIHSAVKNHSDKATSTASKYDEFTKDVDAFDRHLHSLETATNAKFRVRRVLQELNLSSSEAVN